MYMKVNLNTFKAGQQTAQEQEATDQEASLKGFSSSFAANGTQGGFKSDMVNPGLIII